MDNLQTQLNKIEALLTQQSILKKEVLSLEEASLYLGMSKSYLYKLTSQRKIPHFCPEGKKLFFNRAELNQWLQRNRQPTQDEIEQKVADYLISNKIKI